MLVAVTALLLLAEGGMSARTQSRTKRELASPLHLRGIQDPFGSYCQRRGGCCPGRNDQCTVPYLDTICYCDLFCNRTVSDCCPDFWSHCLGTTPPYPLSKLNDKVNSGGIWKIEESQSTMNGVQKWSI
ncbi:hypothetical protein M9458_038127 [Cirrhinus mrigala]|uniref:SMB domain-containing protein n=1 Tax=Cirrhinus mrigala TaxID=683832 RepID=A0ABD0NWM4_CIRMR